MNYFKYNIESKDDKDNKINDIYYYSNILEELSKRSLIKYVFRKNNISGLLMIKYLEVNFKPLNDIIRNHPYDHGYGNFEQKIISLYNDMIKRDKLVNSLFIMNCYDLPKEIVIYILKIYYNFI
jgi:hypothetical protein